MDDKESLSKHARAVEIVMRRAAYRYGEGSADEERRGLAGLLHDADYEQWRELLRRVDDVGGKTRQALTRGETTRVIGAAPPTASSTPA